VAFTNPRLPLLVPRSRSSFMPNVPGHPSQLVSPAADWRGTEARILVSSLGNVHFAYLIKELGTSRQQRL